MALTSLLERPAGTDLERSVSYGDLSPFVSVHVGKRRTSRYACTVRPQNEAGEAVKERVKTKKLEPTLYKVVLLNDDYTTMEFVLQVLETVFQKSPAEAYRIMMHVHVNGRGVAGVYPWEIAETKVETLTTMARHAEYPLRAAIEEA
jgi:ATP-dependent Clp protease adaptor protein ClpS